MSGHIYKHIDLTGSSEVSSDDAIKRAIAKAGDSPDGIRQALKGLKDFPGINGVMNFGPDNVVLLPLRFVKFENGNWVPIKR